MKDILCYFFKALLVAVLFYYSFRITTYYDVAMDGYMLSKTLSFIAGVVLLYKLSNDIRDANK